MSLKITYLSCRSAGLEINKSSKRPYNHARDCIRISTLVI